MLVVTFFEHHLQDRRVYPLWFLNNTTSFIILTDEEKLARGKTAEGCSYVNENRNQLVFWTFRNIQVRSNKVEWCNTVVYCKGSTTFKNMSEKNELGGGDLGFTTPQHD